MNELLVSRNLLSIFRAKSAPCVCIPEFVSEYAKSLAGIGEDGIEEPDPVCRPGARDLAVSGALWALVAVPAVRFAPIADFTRLWVHLVVGFLNTVIARRVLGISQRVPTSKPFVEAQRAMDSLHVPIAAGTGSRSIIFARSMISRTRSFWAQRTHVCLSESDRRHI
jgi:hypothetical protein